MNAQSYMVAAIPAAVLAAMVATLMTWALFRRRDGAITDANDATAILSRITSVEKLAERVATLEETNEALRRQLEARDAEHARELAKRDQTISAQAVLLTQQSAELVGLKQQIDIFKGTLAAWESAAKESRAALRDSLLTATSVATATPKPTSSGSGGE